MPGPGGTAFSSGSVPGPGATAGNSRTRRWHPRHWESQGAEKGWAADEGEHLPHPTLGLQPGKGSRLGHSPRPILYPRPSSARGGAS